jgi:hypothetical protein
MTRGGAYKFDNYVALVGPPDKGVGDKIVRCVRLSFFASCPSSNVKLTDRSSSLLVDQIRTSRSL